MIARLVNGYPVPCPKHGADGSGKYHTNLPRFYENHLEIAADDGYYPVVYTDKPEGNYIDSWSLQLYEGVQSIVQIWTEYTPTPEPIPIDVEKLRADVDYIAMMEEIDLEG